MARTRAQWNTEIDSALSGASVVLSSSGVARWKLWRDLIVTVAILFEGILDLFKTDTDAYMATKQPGTLGWYVDICKLYQHGDSLTVTNGVIGYAHPGANLIVAHASVRELDQDVLAIKVAKLAGSALVPLSGAELTGFKDYMAARRFPGVKINVVSLPADTVQYALTVLYDPLYSQTAVSAAITAALTAFRDNFRFDSVFYVSQFEEAVSAVAGVVDVQSVINIAFGSGDPGISGLTTNTELTAGYFNYSGASTLTLNPAP